MKISIITAVYNNKTFIKSAIESVLMQTYPNIEHIIIDGGSTDGTLEIIKSYQDKISKFISESDKNLYDAINKGIKLATGEIIGTLNADDLFYDEKVVADVAKIFQEKDISALYGNIIYVARDNINKITRKWKSKTFKSGLFEKSWTPAHLTFYAKKECFENYGVYRTDFKIASDVELMYRFLEKHKIKNYYFPRIMVKMRDNGISNKGIKSTVTITKEMKKAIIENGGKFNLAKYLFFKSLKLKEKLIFNSKTK
ncbi:MAG: glycosyltransferase family 2 protein [Candidatus Margulisiibacteriota bacterium]|jgi:glycosyltransferase involved in cell wall biosynthesis